MSTSLIHEDGSGDETADSWRNCELVRPSSTDLAKMVLGQLSVDLKSVSSV